MTVKRHIIVKNRTNKAVFAKFLLKFERRIIKQKDRRYLYISSDTKCESVYWHKF